jgi:hypothetical protein
VTDLVPKTNFPDIRRVCYLRSTTGTILVVPRNDKEVRLYIPVESGSALPDPKELTFDRIMAAAREIMAPYSLEAGAVSWWSAYRVGQRVGSRTSNMHVLPTNPRIHTLPIEIKTDNIVLQTSRATTSAPSSSATRCTPTPPKQARA